jgi:hypothetical protein
MFPWLSTIANAWEKFRIHSLSFRYATAQSTLVEGMVMFAPEFNFTAPDPSTKEELLEYVYSKRTPVWQNLVVPVPASAMMNYKEYYVRDLNSVQSPLLYYPMKLLWATDAVPPNDSYIGELWVDYDIELLYPQKLSPDVTVINDAQSFAFSPSPDGNEFPFQNPTGGYGDLGIEILNDVDLKFNRAFRGLCIVGMQIDGGVDLATDWGVDNYPISWSNNSGPDPTLADGVGGFGRNENANDKITYFLNVNQPQGSVLRCTSFGGRPASGSVQVSWRAVSFVRSPFFSNPRGGWTSFPSSKPMMDPFLKKGQKAKSTVSDRRAVPENPEKVTILTEREREILSLLRKN